VLDDPPVTDSHVVDAPDAGGPPRRFDAEERPEVSARAVEPERHQVALLDDGDELDVRVRKPTTHVLQHDRDEPVGPVHVAQRAVRDEVVVDDGTECGLVVLVDGRDQRLDDCLAHHTISTTDH